MYSFGGDSGFDSSYFSLVWTERAWGKLVCMWEGLVLLLCDGYHIPLLWEVGRVEGAEEAITANRGQGPRRRG